MKQGIEVRPKIIYQEGVRISRPLEVFWHLCVLCILQTGILDYLCAWFVMEAMERRMLFLVSGSAGVLTILLYRFLPKKEFSILFPLGGAVFTACFPAIGNAYYGFFGAVNYMISWWNLKQEDGVRLFLQDKIRAVDIRAFSLVLIFLFMAYFWWAIMKKSLVAAWAFALVIILLGCITGRSSAIGCAALMTGCFGIWIGTIRKEIPGFRQAAWLAGIGICLFGAVYLTGEGSLETVTGMKEQMTETIDEIRYGKDTLPQGDLSKADGLLDGSSDTLKITTGQVKNLYLRGFVGGRYEDGKWKVLPKSAYKGERSGMLDWLKERDIVPQNQYAVYEKIDADNDIKENDVTVENIGADRAYIYLPYSAEAVETFGIGTEYDATYKSKNLFGIKRYSFTEWSGSRPGELLYADSWVDDPQTDGQVNYADAENVYAGFVYDTYLDVDENMAQMIQSIFFDGYTWETENHTIYAVTERIREVLEKRISYQEKPETAPEGTDPISWCLNKSHQGNAVLYASAAVFAYRVQGIPARYTEGYLVSEQQFVSASSDTVTLTNKNSHAWVEVYLDGVGWVPIDVTPGFYYDTYTLLQMVQRPQTVSQTAAEQNSDDLGNELDSDSSSSDGQQDQQDKRHPIEISLTVLACLILLIICCITVLEIRHFIMEMTLGKRYQACSPDERTEKLTAAIFNMLMIYGYQTELGWKVDETDGLLADGMLSDTDSTKEKDKLPLWQDVFVKGEYIRVTELIEKHIYGQETLTDAENRVLYIFAEKLYQLRATFSFKIRIRMRYFFSWKF